MWQQHPCFTTPAAASFPLERALWGGGTRARGSRADLNVGVGSGETSLARPVELVVLPEGFPRSGIACDSMFWEAA